MKRSIFFDLDGTLTDSGEGIIKCAAFALEHFGLPVPDNTTMRQFVGPPLRDTFVKFGVPADKAEEAVTVYRSRYLPIGKFENHPYPGIRELLERLKAEGHRLYVATSKPEELSKVCRALPSSRTASSSALSPMFSSTTPPRGMGYSLRIC